VVVAHNGIARISLNSKNCHFFITSFLGLRGILESRFRRFWYCSMPLLFLRLKSLVL
jgi:hypothetical protein